MNTKIFNKLSNNLYIKFLSLFDNELKKNVNFVIERIFFYNDVLCEYYIIDKKHKQIYFYCNDFVYIYDIKLCTLDCYKIDFDNSIELL